MAAVPNVNREGSSDTLLAQGREAARPGKADGDWKFDVGVAISVYQNSGGPNTQWENFERQKGWFGKPRIKNNVHCGQAADFWNNFVPDIKLAANLGSTCFRLSLEWSRLEPAQGVTDAHGVQRYHDILDCIREHGMEPFVTLHHFAHPQWFEDLGAFSKLANIQHFVAHATHCFREYGSKVRMWCTFNEPEVMGFCGWVYGTFPPARIMAFRAAGIHLWHLFQAHKAAYHAIKALPGGASAQVGIVHNYLRYEMRDPEALSRLYIGPLCGWLNHIWANDIFLDYFKTGKFSWSVPFSVPVRHTEDTPPPLDWLGLNYYSRVCIDWKFSPCGKPGETFTDMPYPLYAAGLHEGLQKYSVLGVPMYITETGIPDASRSGEKRQEMFSTYFPALELAVKDGLDVRGVMYWTLIDNFEWAEGWTIKFGLYSFDLSHPHRRQERPYTPLLEKIFRELPSKMQGHRRAALNGGHGAINGDSRKALL